MIKLNDIYKKNEENWVSRFIADEVVIMPLCRSEDDMQYIYSISNQTGARIFALLDGCRTVRDIQDAIKREFKGNAEAIEREMAEFINDLLSAKLIEKSDKRKIERTRVGRRGSGRKKIYKSPEIAKIKLQPEQAVLSCCLLDDGSKSYNQFTNVCAVGGCTMEVLCNWYAAGRPPVRQFRSSSS